MYSLGAAVAAASACVATASSVPLSSGQVQPFPVSVPELEDAQPASEYLHHRLQKYCAYPPFSVHGEGQFPAVPGLKLRHATILMRHGDRSAIHESESQSSNAAAWQCESPGESEARLAAGLLYPFRSSEECVLRRGFVCDQLESSDIPALAGDRDHALDAWGSARVHGRTCGEAGGELSTRGWEQATVLGHELGEAYGELLRRADGVSIPLQVISTDYGRTALTAAGLVRGMLAAVEAHPVVASSLHEQTSLASAAQAVEEVEEDIAIVNGPLTLLQSHRARHGPLRDLGLPLPLHIVPRPVDPTLFSYRLKQCKKAQRMQEEHKEVLFKHHRLQGSLAERLSSTTGRAVESLPVTEALADVIFARLCHHQPLPCFKDKAGHERCITNEDATEVLQAGDALYASRFNSTPAWTQLLAYPLWSNVLHALTQAMHGEQGAPRVVVRAAHDTVLTPFLGSFGVTDGSYAWPGYASRLAIELWAVPRPARVGQAPGYAQSFVRLLYNGQDWTHKLPCVLAFNSTGEAFASTKRHITMAQFAGMPEETLSHPEQFGVHPEQVKAIRRAYDDFVAQMQADEDAQGPSVPATVAPSTVHLCSYSSFERMVHGMIAPSSTWQQACEEGEEQQGKDREL